MVSLGVASTSSGASACRRGRPRFRGGESAVELTVSVFLAGVAAFRFGVFFALVVDLGVACDSATLISDALSSPVALFFLVWRGVFCIGVPARFLGRGVGVFVCC